MAYYQHRVVGIGSLLSGTFSELTKIKRPLALYFGGFFALGVLEDLIWLSGFWIAAGAFFAYFFAQYYLYRELLHANGISTDNRTKIFSFFFSALIIGLAMNFASSLFLIPAILLAAKWLMTPASIVAEEGNLFDAMGESWRASENNLVNLSIAFSLVCLIWFAAAIPVFVLAGLYEWLLSNVDASPNSEDLNAVAWLALHLLPVLLMGLSVSAYRALSKDEESLVAVFE